uniref:Thioredoxin-like protein Clot n=1 Tax=Wollemia nobilis TaxID=56998 RepID=A0A0C9SB29_9CONI
MGFTQIDAKVDNFSAALTSVEANNDKDRITLLLFLADKDPSSGLSWCPDCVRAEPVIYKTLEKSGKNVTLLRGFAGDRPTWRNPSHPWRMDERFKLKGLPTLIRWKEGAIAGRLEDHEAHIESRISKLLD